MNASHGNLPGERFIAAFFSFSLPRTSERASAAIHRRTPERLASWPFGHSRQRSSSASQGTSSAPIGTRPHWPTALAATASHGAGEVAGELANWRRFSSAAAVGNHRPPATLPPSTAATPNSLANWRRPASAFAHFIGAPEDSLPHDAALGTTIASFEAPPLAVMLSCCHLTHQRPSPRPSSPPLSARHLTRQFACRLAPCRRVLAAPLYAPIE